MIDSITYFFVENFLVQIIDVGEYNTLEEKEREKREYKRELLSLILD
jgi:hypothetical protein